MVIFHFANSSLIKGGPNFRFRSAGIKKNRAGHGSHGGFAWATDDAGSLGWRQRTEDVNQAKPGREKLPAVGSL
jgi:hypothetical protein